MSAYMVHWESLLHLTDVALAAHDVAAVNLACTWGLPGAEGLDVARCLRVMDGWAGTVARETNQCAAQFRKDPASFENSWAYFRVLVMATVLQQDCGVRYAPTLVDRDDFFRNAGNLFVHGVIQGKGGTCSSLPPVYVAVGRRLGYPLKLVQTHSHLFARWDDQEAGERFNVECTSHGINVYSDDHYRNWPRPTTPRDVERYGWLVSQTPREDLAGFLVSRGHCLLDNRHYGQAVEAYAEAAALTSRHHGYEECVRAAMSLWRERTIPPSPTYHPAATAGQCSFPMGWHHPVPLLGSVSSRESMRRSSRFGWPSDEPRAADPPSPEPTPRPADPGT